MLRRILAKPPSAGIAASRWLAGVPQRRGFAAATSREKRALDAHQFSGSGTTASTTSRGGGDGGGAKPTKAAAGGRARPAPPPTSTAALPSNGGGADAGGNNNNNNNNNPLFALLAVAAIGGVGAAYSQGLIPGLAAHPEEGAEPEPEPVASKSEDTPTTTAATTAAPAPATTAAPAAPATTAAPAPATTAAPAATTAATATTTSSTKEKAPSTNEKAPNRVLQISLPPGSTKASSSSSSSPPPSEGGIGHPTGGHKVLMTPGGGVSFSSSSSSAEPSVDAALQELQSQLSRDTSRALSEAHLELAKLSSLDVQKELETLTPMQLKIRLVQMAKDLEERTKWEAVRLKEFLALKEREVKDKYVIMMKNQRLEAESTMEQKLRGQQYELTSQAEKVIHEKEQALQAIVGNSLKIQEAQFDDEKVTFQTSTEEATSAKYEEMFGKSMTEAKQAFSQKMEQKVQQIESLSKKLSELEFALQNTKTYQTGSLQAHRMSAAALSLIDTLESSKPAGPAVAALRSVSEDNAVVAAALTTLPDSVQTSGVVSLQELQANFEETVHNRCRQAALVPAGQQGLEGQLLGMAFATLKFPPGPDDAAPETTAQEDSEFVLARVRRHVQLGDLEDAVTQMDQLKGQASVVAQDWIQKAKERVAVEKALKVIRMECALANVSMSHSTPMDNSSE